MKDYRIILYRRLTSQLLAKFEGCRAKNCAFRKESEDATGPIENRECDCKESASEIMNHLSREMGKEAM
jgi:hypothetical protein